METFLLKIDRLDINGRSLSNLAGFGFCDDKSKEKKKKKRSLLNCNLVSFAGADLLAADNLLGPPPIQNLVRMTADGAIAAGRIR